jgi:hypothetical protein
MMQGAARTAGRAAAPAGPVTRIRRPGERHRTLKLRLMSSSPSASDGNGDNCAGLGGGGIVIGDGPFAETKEQMAG